MRKTMKMTLLGAAMTLAFAPAFAADQTYTADIVVIGAGASGTAAAWAAAEKGFKVVTLEKAAAVGGTGKFSEGIFAVESKMQHDWNYALTKDEAFQKIMNYGHWRGNAKMVRAFVNKSADTIDWMQKNGVVFEKLFSNYPNGLYTWHIYKGRGAGWINLFQQKYKEKGQTLLLNTWGTKLITDNGRVTGVEATNKAGDKITVNAKATIIATGGFFANREMAKKYLRFPDADGLAQTGKTGDGIRMAWDVGGGKEGTEVQASYRPGPRGVATTNHVSATAKQPLLWLTPKGDRFCDEKIMLQWPFAGNALERIGGTMYVVYDQKTLDHMINDGIDLGVGVMVPVGTKLTKFNEEFADAQKAGWAFKADTLEGLAKATGMDPDRVKKTVEAYNHFCDVRHDEEFAKDPSLLREVKTGPFYAIKSVASTLGTLGGIKANERFEVVTQKEDPIPGLYAAGNDVGGMYGDSYDLLMAGSTVGFAVNSGRIAVDSAAEYIKTLK
jgi:fumarate reductase flavoprotein subunit